MLIGPAWIRLFVYISFDRHTTATDARTQIYFIIFQDNADDAPVASTGSPAPMLEPFNQIKLGPTKTANVHYFVNVIEFPQNPHNNETMPLLRLGAACK